MSSSDTWSAAIERAHAVWPADWIPDDVFAAHLAARVGEDRRPAMAADLYLACACARGVPAAVEAFSKKILVEVTAHVASIDRTPAFADDVRQLLAEKLLVGDSPRIADYAGSAPLSAWVRVAAIRTALNLKRGKAQSAERDDERALAAHADAASLEGDVIRRRWGPAFEQAIAKGLGLLSTRERALLRLRVVEGLELEQIATMYAVHRATVVRWLAACRERLFEITKDELGLADSELESLAGAIQSQLHVSVGRLLAGG
jgi:RNA polymerase sigma-70 factor (ECF subfamily)